MGYYTEYELTVIPGELHEAVAQAIEGCAGYNPFLESTKWYDHQEHVNAVSKSIPALIIIDGSGESSGDIWRKAWLNGKRVMEWKVDATPPEPSKELLHRLKTLDAERKQNRIAELEAELAKLKESM